MALPDINIFYHVWFKWVDPLVLVCSVYTLVFTPQIMIDAFISPSVSVYNPDQEFLVHQLAAMFAFMAITLGGILHVSQDIKVWRVIIAAVLLADIAMLAGVYASLKQQDRLRLDAMRSADWGNILFTELVTAIRIFFLLGIGVQDEGIKSKKL